MTQSTLTAKGQTTIPLKVRRALGLKPGTRLIYEVKGDSAIIRAQPALMAAFGALKSAKAGQPFSEAREAATRAWVRSTTRKR